jgi:Spy/CpxP family protein refolding chaperone
MKKIICSLVLAAGAMLAQPPAGRTPNVTDVKAYLGLSDATVTSLEQLLTAERQAVQALAQQIGQKRQDLQAALTAGNSNAATLGQFLLDIAALQKQIDQKRADYRPQAVALLSTDQQTKLKALAAAQALLPAVQEATMLNLLAGPANSGVPGRGGFGGPRGFGPQGGPGERGFGPSRFRGGPPPNQQ